MSGLSKASSDFYKILWSDAEILTITIDYANFILNIRESTGRACRIVCKGYIGYEMNGFWDEIVIAKACLDSEGEFFTRCLESLDTRLGSNRPDSGSEVRNSGIGMQLTIVLSDGCELRVAMKGFSLELGEPELVSS